MDSARAHRLRLKSLVGELNRGAADIICSTQSVCVQKEPKLGNKTRRNNADVQHLLSPGPSRHALIITHTHTHTWICNITLKVMLTVVGLQKPAGKLELINSIQI